jgi:hypothetical protein
VVEFPPIPPDDPDLALSNARLADLHARFGDRSEAIDLLKRAREILKPLAQRSGNPVWLGYVRNFDADIARYGHNL